jgi:MerR family mercuric resistance operon transcriptional regulator
MQAIAGRFAIGVLSKRTGCHVETIRYYERAGLLPTPARSPGGYRLYGADHLKRLAFVRRARALGFSIHEIRALLALADHRKRPCAEARGLAAAHLDDVRAKIASLREMERVLRGTVARCASGKASHCPLIDALYRDDGGGPTGARRAPGSLSRGDWWSTMGPLSRRTPGGAERSQRDGL